VSCWGDENPLQVTGMLLFNKKCKMKSKLELRLNVLKFIFCDPRLESFIRMVFKNTLDFVVPVDFDGVQVILEQL